MLGGERALLLPFARSARGEQMRLRGMPRAARIARQLCWRAGRRGGSAFDLDLRDPNGEHPTPARPALEHSARAFIGPRASAAQAGLVTPFAFDEREEAEAANLAPEKHPQRQVEIFHVVMRIEPPRIQLAA